MGTEETEGGRIFRVLAVLWRQRRAAALGALAGQASLPVEVVGPILNDLVLRQWVRRYEVAGQPHLYLWAAACTPDMVKTAEMVRRLTKNIPLTSDII